VSRDSDVLNAIEAAALLGSHVETIRKLARRNEIPCFKAGRDWRFRKEALLRWADEQRSGAGDCSVLIIDDDENACSSFRRILRRVDCRVLQATSAADGLDLVAREAPDLILLDLLMPEMNGPQFLEELRKKYPDLPVVIVTGYPDSELMKQAMRYAPLMLLEKPVDPDLLERTVRMVLGKKTASESATA